MNELDYPYNSIEILKRKKSFRRQLLEQSGLLEKRIAILSGSTVGDIKSMLELFLLHSGIRPHFYVGQYNRFYEEVMFENQALIDFKPEMICIHTTTRNLSDHGLPDKLESVRAKIKNDFSCPVIQNNFELPPCGSALDCRKVNELNLKMADYAEQNKDFYINDIQYLSADYGIGRWFDEQDYFLYKYAFSVGAVPLYCHNTAKIIKSIYGRNQKCLVLDLDNTLWGGAVGDLGAMGIELGMETSAGEAYVAFQQYIKVLHGRGIILAVCSKNDARTAREAFSNPNMVLSLDDIAVFCANWNSKAENILHIADELNISSESIVFVDDNPAERELVKQTLPDIKVIEADSVVDFTRHIEAAGYFYATAVSDDDRNRNAYYAADKKRNEARNIFVNYDDYLCSLHMSALITSFDPAYTDRITQLINKTNQFNLTAKRCSASEVEKIAKDSDFVALYATLEDKFGSNGIVSALIGEIDGKSLHIQIWVMSCRVFKRELEYAMIDRLRDICKNKDLEKIVGYYCRTEKNGYVSSLLSDLDFKQAADDTWEFDLTAEYRHKNKYIQIRKETQ